VLCLAALLGGAGTRAASAQARPAPAPITGESNAVREHPLKRYSGRYELEVGLIPISTLDVTLVGDELWLKPSQAKRRRLVKKRGARFADEVEGTSYKFGLDEEGRAVSVTFDYGGATYTARRVELPPPSLKGNTTFRLKGHADASVVALAGSFNNWHQSQLLCARDGDGWVCRVDLEPGRYTYKFIVDGNWLLDPANPDSEEDEAGNVNNVLVIPDKPPAPGRLILAR
jgi:hypothetical protein